MVIEALSAKQKRLVAAHPDYCTIGEFARMLNLHRAAARRSAHKVLHQSVEGVLLFHRQSAKQFAATFQKNETKVNSRTFRGLDALRIEQICEKYYKTQYDVAPADLLSLAKRIAKL